MSPHFFHPAEYEIPEFFFFFKFETIILASVNSLIFLRFCISALGNYCNKYLSFSSIYITCRIE